MKAAIETRIDIHAKPEEVWEVLMNTSEYPEWNPFIKEMTGVVEVGQKLKVKLLGMTFKPIVQKVEVNRKFAWLGKLGIKGVFDGHHQFELIPTAEGTTFIHKEDFKGWLTKWFMRKKAEETQSGFEEMNQALKKRVEEKYHH